MASKRMIASDIFEDDFYAGLSMIGRQLWIGLIVRDADDQGRLQDNCELMKSHIFPYDRISPDDLVPILSEIEKAGKIYRYKAGGKRLIQIVNWWRYQTLTWAMPSKYPPPEGWTDREKYHTPNVTNKVTTRNWDRQGGFSVAIQAPTQGDTQGQSNEIDEKRREELINGLTPESENPEGGEDMPFRDPVWDLLHGETPEPEEHGPDIEWAAEDTKELAAVFLVNSNLPPPMKDSERKYWIASLREMRLQGINGETLKAAIEKMRADRLTIKAPGSVQAVALDLKACGGASKNGRVDNRLLPDGV